MALLILGGEQLTDFEIPSEVQFGGAQKLAIHKLIGGARIIDVMGPDDASIKWAGIFSGTYAGDRARMFDAMRVAGAPVGLTWDAFCYLVVIETLVFDFRNPWWIPYQISCAIAVDQAQSMGSYAPDLAQSILSDLTAASAYDNVSAALAATSVADALTQGNADYISASTSLLSAANAITANIEATQENIAGIETNQTSFSSSDLADLVTSSGTLAQLCTARGYIERCSSNLSGAGT